MMQQAVQDRIGNGNVANPAMPVLGGKLRGDDGGTVLGAVVDDLQEVFASDGLQRMQSPVIEHQGIDLGECREAALVGAIAASDAQFLQQPGKASVEGG